MHTTTPALPLETAVTAFTFLMVMAADESGMADPQDARDLKQLKASLRASLAAIEFLPALPPEAPEGPAPAPQPDLFVPRFTDSEVLRAFEGASIADREALFRASGVIGPIPSGWMTVDRFLSSLERDTKAERAAVEAIVDRLLAEADTARARTVQLDDDRRDLDTATATASTACSPLVINTDYSASSADCATSDAGCSAGGGE